jgi:hypothetical protein
MTQNEIQSELNRAYIHAAASRVCCACQWADRQTDNFGIDLTIRFKGDISTLQGLKVSQTVVFDVQLKSCSQSVQYDKQDRIIFDGLKKSCYDDLRNDNRNPSAFLILFILPENPDEWLKLDEESLILQKCAYWVSLRGAPKCDTVTKRIFFPKKQLFNMEQLANHILPTLATEKEFYYVS